MAPVFTANILLTLYILFQSYFAFSDVQEITIKTTANTAADSACDLQITLWFNSMIYESTVSQPKDDTIYTISEQSLSSHIDPSNCHKSKMMLQCDDTNAVQIEEISFKTISGEWYGCSGFCMHDSIYPQNSRGSRQSNHPNCASNYLYFEYLCIDNEEKDDNCAPSKQIVYFDTLHPNQYIRNTSWEDGTNITPETDTDTCDPTHDPTFTPTKKPTSEPTNYPTYDPTPTPTKEPTSKPTNYPTKYPTNTTDIPAYNPTVTIGGVTSRTESILSSDINPTITERVRITSNIYDKHVNNGIPLPFVVFVALLSCGGCLCLCCALLWHKRSNVEIKESPNTKNRVSPNKVMIVSAIGNLKHVDDAPAPKPTIERGEQVLEMIRIQSKSYDDLEDVVLGGGEFVVEGDDNANNQQTAENIAQHSTRIYGMKEDDFIVVGNDETQGNLE